MGEDTIVRVLVVEDEKVIRESLATIISRRIQGSAVTVADSLDAALQHNAGDFDIVIADYELSKANRSITSVPAIERHRNEAKVILTTSNLMSTTEWKSLGVHAYMQKPLTGEKLVQLIRDLLIEKDLAPS